MRELNVKGLGALPCVCIVCCVFSCRFTCCVRCACCALILPRVLCPSHCVQFAPASVSRKSRGFATIEDLHPYKEDWCLKAKVDRKVGEGGKGEGGKGCFRV